MDYQFTFLELLMIGTVLFLILVTVIYANFKGYTGGYKDGYYQGFRDGNTNYDNKPIEQVLRERIERKKSKR